MSTKDRNARAGTPDGISGSDWDVVHDLALGMVNASSEEESGLLRQQLLEYLDDLETRYGELPSILATRADYISDVAVRRDLLVRAYELAISRQDERNALYTASSLASLYASDLRNATSASEWLSRARGHVEACGDDVDRWELDRIQDEIDG